MTPMTATASGTAPRQNWFSKTESWLDARGKGAWIVASVLGFIVFWPVGLAILGYAMWSNRMFTGKCSGRARHARTAFKSSGNSAFDAYKSDTLRRLEEEQEAFEEFLNRLRDAKDKAEFDQFMDERSRSARTEANPTEA